jgi:hypothetical protein
VDSLWRYGRTKSHILGPCPFELSPIPEQAEFKILASCGA